MPDKALRRKERRWACVRLAFGLLQMAGAAFSALLLTIVDFLFVLILKSLSSKHLRGSLH